ncbi:MAG: Inositol monophosphatase family protein [Rickettsiales bacterium]|jgi:histidinol phosphatase-like enzyme (inositol monophosphatase family)|nr:Inositol monophosphatase family protein [Rickettsiales bacterium]
MQNHTEYLTFAKTLADASGAVIKGYFRNHGVAEHKADQTPVTIADREAETVMRELIESHYPTHGIIGEEFGNIRETAEYVWVLDPIDGTVSFTIGRPIFGTLISLVYRGEPVLGVIDQPITGERWIGIPGAGYSAFYHRGERTITKARDVGSLAEAVVSTTGPNYLNASEWDKFQRAVKASKRVSYGGDCYQYGLVAFGLLDVVIEAGLKPYDFCALAPVVIAAGGVFTDWEGKPITLSSEGQVVAAGSKAVHKEALALLKR